MKTILYRLSLIILIFYSFNIFLVYIILFKGSNIANKFLFYILLSLIIFIFCIYLFFRTSHYIVKPIKNILYNFEKFPHLDNKISSHTKILEINLLTQFTLQFLEKYSKYLKELNLEKLLLNTLLNNLQEGVICFNKEGYILYINDFVRIEFCIEDISYQLFNNKYYYEIIKNPIILDIVYKVLHKKNISNLTFANKKYDNEFEFNYKDKFYRLRYYELQLDSVIQNDFNNNINKIENESLYLFIINDLTEEYNVKRMREDFLQNASHELKTPITSIRGYTETLLDKISNNDNEIYSNFLKGILRNTERMERIIYDMVMISSLESRSYPFHPTEIELENFFNELSLLIEGILKTKNIKIEYFIHDNISTLYADPLLLEHLFINLISNAVRFSQENNKIQIEVKKLNKEKICISVIDYGPGIPDDYKNKIFERFFRIDKDRSRKEGGTGLGLSIVKQIVRIHNGNVFVKDNPQGGSIFVIHLPI